MSPLVFSTYSKVSFRNRACFSFGNEVPVNAATSTLIWTESSRFQAMYNPSTHEGLRLYETISEIVARSIFVGGCLFIRRYGPPSRRGFLRCHRRNDSGAVRDHQP